MAWTILLVLVAGAGDGSAPLEPAHARAAQSSTLRVEGQAGSRPGACSIARKAWHRAGSLRWSVAGSEDCDTEEVDESWAVDLDAIATIPGSWLGLAWCRSRSEVFSAGSRPSPRVSAFPLRC